MGTVFDIIGSTLIRGAIMLAMINLTVQMNTALYKKTSLAAARQALVIPAQILYNDILGAGYGQAFPKTMAIAKRYEIQFNTCIDTLGTVGSVHYVLDKTNLCRTVGAGARQVIGHGVTSLRIDYYDSLGGSMSTGTNIGKIKQIRFRMTVLPDNLPNGERKDSTYWERRVFPPNLYY
jgi:hypothetical protein